MAGPFAAQRLGDLGRRRHQGRADDRRVAAARRRGRRARQRDQRLVPLAEPQQALDRRRPQVARTGARSLYRARRRRPTSSCRTTGRASPARLGVDYESLRAINPSIVYVSISGYGEDGPYRDRPGQDLLLQAMIGRDAVGRVATASRRRPPGSTSSTPSPRRRRSRPCSPRSCTASAPARDSCVTVNMLDVITTLQMQEISVFTMGGIPQERSAEPHAHVYIRSPYGTFATTRRLPRARDAEPSAARRADRRARLRGLRRRGRRVDPARRDLRARSPTGCATRSTDEWLDDPPARRNLGRARVLATPISSTTSRSATTARSSSTTTPPRAA